MNPKVIALLVFAPVFAVSIIFAGNLNRKPGYVITNRDDTLSCMLKGNPSATIYYKTADDSAYIAVSPEYIKEIRYLKNRHIYKAVTLPGGITPQYLRLIDTGTINIYLLNEQIGKTVYTHLYALKAKSTLIKIFGYNPGKKNKDVLTGLVNDNNAALDYLIAQKNYDYNTVINTVKLYNGEGFNK